MEATRTTAKSGKVTWEKAEIQLLLSKWRKPMLRKGGNFPSEEDLRDFIAENQAVFAASRTTTTTRTFMHKFINSKHAKNLENFETTIDK